MSVIALVDLREKDKTEKKSGDIICVKLNDAPWGKEEEKQFLRVCIEDSDLENELIAMQASDPYPVIIYPYKKMEDDKITNRSIKKIDVKSVSQSVASNLGTTANTLQDRKTVKPIVYKASFLGDKTPFKLSDLVSDDSDRT